MGKTPSSAMNKSVYTHKRDAIPNLFTHGNRSQEEEGVEMKEEKKKEEK